MDLGLKDKVVAVTGASRGIGRAIAQAFASEGARVAALARTEGDLASTVEMMEGGAGTHLAVTCDVTDPEQAMSALDHVRSDLGGLDILVNNAGRRQNFSRLDTLDMDEWRVAIEANLSSVFYMSRAAVTSMIEQRSGSIVNISSIAGPVAFASIGAYSAAKAGVIALTKVMAVEWAEFGIRANSVAPGWTESSMNYELRTDPANRDLLESIRDQIVMKRFAIPSETANAVLFLAGDSASYITGETVVVDGGWLAEGWTTG
ncbi:MAG: SDR family oxidoreductase [bacterium]|nr:SDR family oxidoreductase [bacterium]MDE0289365.1 SDR family oxidoreductase [bacterium]MDE0439437.1 SDR family oxidoreductase [bacterium]